MRPSQCASRLDILLEAEARPAQPVLEPASLSDHLPLGEAAVVEVVPFHPEALRLRAEVALEAAEASPHRLTSRPEAMQQGVAADPLALRLSLAATLARRAAASAYLAHGLPSPWQTHSDKSAK